MQREGLLPDGRDASWRLGEPRRSVGEGGRVKPGQGQSPDAPLIRSFIRSSLTLNGSPVSSIMWQTKLDLFQILDHVGFEIGNIIAQLLKLFQDQSGDVVLFVGHRCRFSYSLSFRFVQGLDNILESIQPLTPTYSCLASYDFTFGKSLILEKREAPAF
jgi:hypothetical protein